MLEHRRYLYRGDREVSRNFKNSTLVVSYLYKKYGKLHDQKIEDEIDIIKRIKRDHTQDELKMMKRRLTSSIDYVKESNSLFSQPIPIMLSFLTIMSTLFVLMVTTVTNYSGKAVDSYKEEVSKEEFIAMYDYEPVFDSIMKNILIGFVVIILMWVVTSMSFLNRYRRRQSALILIEETIEENINVTKAP